MRRLWNKDLWFDRRCRSGMCGVSPRGCTDGVDGIGSMSDGLQPTACDVGWEERAVEDGESE